MFTVPGNECVVRLKTDSRLRTNSMFTFVTINATGQFVSAMENGADEQQVVDLITSAVQQIQAMVLALHRSGKPSILLLSFRRASRIS